MKKKLLLGGIIIIIGIFLVVIGDNIYSSKTLTGSYQDSYYGAVRAGDEVCKYFSIPEGSYYATAFFNVEVLSGNDIVVKIENINGLTYYNKFIRGRYSDFVTLDPGSYKWCLDNTYSFITTKEIKADLTVEYEKLIPGDPAGEYIAIFGIIMIIFGILIIIIIGRKR